MVIIPVTGLRARGPHPEPTTVAAAATPVVDDVVVDEHAEVDRASRSDGWARRALEQMPLEETTTSEAPPTTAVAVRKAAAAPAVRAQAVTTTTAKPRPTTTTTAAPKAAVAPTRDASPPTTTESNSQSGKASWYDAAPAGTCAHRTLPMGTIVTVTATARGKSTTCRVADRGPYVNGWIIDLSKETFSSLAPLDDGVISVRLTW
jgi:rare lipoprotein A